MIKKYNLYLEINKSFKYNINVKNSNDILNFLKTDLKMSKQCEEVLNLLCLDTKNNISGIFEVNRGILNASLTSPREIFKRAIICNAKSIILAHNHPSDNVKPSIQDIELTERIKNISKLMDIPLLDHIIISNNNNYYSFFEEGTLWK